MGKRERERGLPDVRIRDSTKRPATVVNGGSSLNSGGGPPAVRIPREAESKKWDASRYEATGIWTREARHAGIIGYYQVELQEVRDAGYFKARRLVIIMHVCTSA